MAGEHRGMREFDAAESPPTMKRGELKQFKIRLNQVLKDHQIEKIKGNHWKQYPNDK